PGRAGAVRRRSLPLRRAGWWRSGWRGGVVRGGGRARRPYGDRRQLRRSSARPVNFVISPSRHTSSELPKATQDAQNTLKAAENNKTNCERPQPNGSAAFSGLQRVL